MAQRKPASLCVVAGTRPEFIKLAPLLHALRQRPESARWQVRFIATGQHPHLTHSLCAELALTPDVDLGSGPGARGLLDLAGRLLSALEDQTRDHQRPDAIVVQGDTMSALAGAMAGFYGHIPVVHLEAGLRSGSLREPFPEEANRRIISSLSAVHLAPTPGAVRNLLSEGIAPEQIACIGNTVVDAVRLYRGGPCPVDLPRPYIVATGHRRENWQRGIGTLLAALRDIAADGTQVVFLLHPNPVLATQVRDALAGTPGVWLLPPQPYAATLTLLDGAAAIVTDSGGLQEEAPAFGVPVVVARRQTERPEVLNGHGGQISGTSRRAITAAIRRALKTERPARPVSPFGDGRAAERAVTVLARMFAGLQPLLPEHQSFVPGTHEQR